MDSPSWSDAFLATFSSCLHCFKSPLYLSESDNDNDRESQNLRHTRTVPRHLESLLRDSNQDTETDSVDAETVSLRSDIGGNAGGRRRVKDLKRGKRITFFGYDLFGRTSSQGGVYLPEDEDEVDDLLGRSRRSGHRRTKRDSTSLVSSTLTFDSDASPLDSSELTPEILEERRVRQVELEEEELRAKEERRRRRKERKEMKRIAKSLRSGGALDVEGEGEFEGFQGSGGGFSSVSVAEGHSTTALAPAKLLLHAPDEAEDDDEADLDGILYAGRKSSSNNSNSGGGSNSRLSPSDASSSSRPYPRATMTLPPPTGTSTPTTEPAKRKKKKSSSSSSSKSKNNSKSSKSHSSTTSSTPSLVSPGTSNNDIDVDVDDGSSVLYSPLSVDVEGQRTSLGLLKPEVPLEFELESGDVVESDRGFPSSGLGGGVGRRGGGQSGAFLATTATTMTKGGF